jgi:hypothetical protein
LKETVGNGGFSAALRVDSASNPAGGTGNLLNSAGGCGIIIKISQDYRHIELALTEE